MNESETEAVRQICSWILVILVLGCGFFLNVYTDFNGRSGKEPPGFKGFIGTLITTVLLAALFWGAGVFENLW